MIITPGLPSNEIEDNICLAFQKAAADTSHNLRFFTVSTYNIHTSAPESRMVVLRRFLSDWTIRFFTDYRSSKVSEIKNHPMISLLFWNPEERYQIRVQASATVHYQNEISYGEWQHVNGRAQDEYKAFLPPGAKISSSAEALQKKSDSHYFAVVDALPLQIKILQINRSKHLSMNFKRQSAADKWKGKWIVP